ncbi:MAG: hypothetical protein WCX97_01785 [Candidatus Magasanikbacteria bacterium]
MARPLSVKKTTTKKNKKKAVNTPGLIPKHKENSASPDAISNDTKQLLSHYAQYRAHESARRLMWISIIMFALVIVALWGWAMRFRIANISSQSQPTTSLMSDAKKNWNEIFTETKQKEEMKKEIIKLLSQLTIPTSTPATTTINNNISSSTLITTTTEKTNTQPTND